MIDDKQKYLRELISKIKRLTSKEKHHILSIFKKYNVEFTKNSNGYFFNLDKIDDEILDKVSKCVDLIEQKRELITALDKKRDSYLEYYKNLIENKLKETINKRREHYINQLILIPDENPIRKKIKKSVRIMSTIDPDILMKEHNKSKKYDKNSVYFRINQRIIALSRKSNRHRSSDKSKDEGDDSSFNYGGNGDGEDNVDGGDMDISGDNDHESGDLEGLHDELADSIGEEYLDGDNNEEEDDSNLSGYGDNDTEDVDDDEYYKDTNSDSDDDTHTEHKTEKTERTDNKTKTTRTKNKNKNKKKKKDIEASSNEVDYYKTLLKQSGFKFDDDKGVEIKVESYIE
jgi:hypothetical protein